MIVKRVCLFLLLVLVIVGVIFAQNNTGLRPGVYRSNIVTGEGRMIVANYGSNKTTPGDTRKIIVVYHPEGTIAFRGEARINGARVRVDFGSSGAETWTIIDEETFIDDKLGVTWEWFRPYRNNELPN